MLFWGVGIYRIMKKYCVFRYYAEFGVRRYALRDARVHLCPHLPSSQMSWWENWPAPIFPALHQAFPGLKAAVLEISLILVIIYGNEQKMWINKCHGAPTPSPLMALFQDICLPDFVSFAIDGWILYMKLSRKFWLVSYYLITLKNLSPEWIVKCFLKLPDPTDAKSYLLHLNDFLAVFCVQIGKFYTWLNIFT